MNQVNNGVCPDCGRGVGDWHKGDCPKRKDKIQGVTPEDVAPDAMEQVRFMLSVTRRVLRWGRGR